MATNTIKARFAMNHKTQAEWEASTLVLLNSEPGLATDTLCLKYGNGVDVWKDLPTAYLTPEQVQSLIDTNKYILPIASDTVLGGVKIGTNVNIDANGVISINNASTSQKGVVQLSDAVNSTSTTLAATANAVKKAYDQANKMVPLAGGVTMTGLLTLSGNPTADMGAATKLYVDTQITEKLKTSDAMVYRGTLGSNGTVTALPTTNIVQGDTYKVITAGTYAGYTCKVGDLLIANSSGSLTTNSTNWSYVPSGDEKETTIRYATSGVNLTTSAKTGDVILGAASIKQVDTSISAASTSANLPTSAAVAAFVEGKGYVTTDNKVLNTLNTTQKAYVTGTTSATTNTGTQVFDTGVYLGATAGELYATTFRGALVGNVTGNLTGNVTGNVTGNSDTASKLKSPFNLSIANATKSVDGSSNVTFAASELGLKYSDINPIESETYTGIYASANDFNNATFYFGTLRPTSWEKEWHIRYRIYSSVPGQTNYSGYFDVELYGAQNARTGYKIFNAHYNTSYRTLYNHVLYSLTSTGYSNGYGHALGIGLKNSTNPTSSSYPRTFQIDILELDNCTVTMLDTMKLYSALTGTGSTNYNGYSEFDGNNGLRETGDDNNYDRLLMAQTQVKAGTNGIKQTSIIMKDVNGTWQSLTTTNGNGTTKTKNTTGFYFDEILFYSGGNINANSLASKYCIHSACSNIDFRYSTNCGTTLTANQSIYLKGTIANGLFYLADTWWTQTLPTSDDGFVYIYIGETHNTNNIDFYATNPILWYKNGALRQYGDTGVYTTSAGTNNQILASSGTENTKWINQSSIAAGTAEKWATARTVSLTGAVTGSASIDGSGDVTITTAVNHTHPYLKLDGTSQMTGDLKFSGTNSIHWNSNTYQQRIAITDDSTAGTAVFNFQQSSDSGSNWSNLMIIQDDGKVIADTFVGALQGNANTADKWKTARTVTLAGAVTGNASIDGSGDVTITTTVNHTHSYLPLGGGTMTGNILFSNSGTNPRGIQGTCGDNDMWRVVGGATATNAGYLEIATADDYSEPIYVRQYGGSFATIQRTATLLDASGNTSFPGNVTASKFIGALQGNADTATKWQTGRKITLTGDASGNVTFDGSADVSLAVTVLDDSHNHTKFNCVDITGQTIDLNNYNLNSGTPHKIFYIEKTDGGAANITNAAVSNKPFVLAVELIRYNSTDDYITKQTFVSTDTKSTYERWCTSGTWTAWLPVARFSETPIANRILIADGTTGAIKASSYTVGAAAAKGVTDSTSASAIGTGTNLTTERDIYYGLPTINTKHDYTSATTIFAPITGGTSGQLLQSAGNAAPTWVNKSSVTVGKATALETARNFSISGYATASAVEFDGSGDVSLDVTVLNAMGLRVNAGDTLIIDGSVD